MHAASNADRLARVGYQPPDQYNLDMEVFRVSDLWRRQGKDAFRRAHRVEFYQLLCVTDGACNHIVDFQSVPCKAGSVYMTRPGQAQQFDIDSDWEGWLVLFQSDFLLPAHLPASGQLQQVAEPLWLGQHLSLPPASFQSLIDGIGQMRQDAGMPGQKSALHALLRHQLHTLLIRLKLFSDQSAAAGEANQGARHRFQRFQDLVEQQFRQWHQVQDYANALGCAKKTLNRAALEVADANAKAVITRRITLEAKRLLAHTTLPVSLIAEQLGFDEPTNFTKFFVREAAALPSAFRRIHQDRDA